MQSNAAAEAAEAEAASHGDSKTPSDERLPGTPLVCYECIRHTMELLEVLLASSADVRDFFILLAYGLARVRDKESFFNLDLVDRCFNLVNGKPIN